jgi:hypothetical protein
MFSITPSAMKCKDLFLARTWNPWLLVLCGIVALTAGCSRRSGARAPQVFLMGERVEVGPLIYVVQDLEWRDQLGEGIQAQMPRHRFLLVRLSVTNSGIRETDIPPLAVIGSDGRQYPELEKVEGVPEWLGYLRTIQPAATEHGRVAFDVPKGAYRLRVAAVLDDDQEREALVELPYQGMPSPQLPLTGPGTPSQ